MACQRCLTSLNAAYENLTHTPYWDSHDEHSNVLHGSLSGLQNSVMQGCWICRYLWKDLYRYIIKSTRRPDLVADAARVESEFSGIGNSATNEDRFAAEFEIIKKIPEKSPVYMDSKHFNIQFTMDGPFGSGELFRMTLRAEYDRYAHDHFESFIFLYRSPGYGTVDASDKSNLTDGSTVVMQNPELWSQWYRTCSKSHPKCHELDHEPSTFAPDRLIKISLNEDEQTFTWSLVHREDIGNVEYLTLSHCWGSTGHTSLTKSSYTDFTGLNQDTGLPRSFRHAFSITCSLGFQYIWIDSLCIVQDDPEDWKAQASMMGSVYQHASCNIAAAWAANGDYGCFAPIDSRIITVKLGSNPPTDYHVVPGDLHDDNVLDAPLNARGWVAQERYLAKKQLVFARTQVYWECRELVASEQQPTGGVYNLTTAKPSIECKTEKEYRQAWTRLICFYSKCKFSRISDRMIALAGLAEKTRCATEDVYLAGLWKKDLETQLCWCTDFDLRSADSFRTPMYIAPTWSWASIDAPVSPRGVLKESSDSKYLSEVIDVSIESDHFSGLHSFVASKLILRGIAVNVRAISIDTNDYYGWKLQSTSGNDDWISSRFVRIIWDENMRDPVADPNRWISFAKERNSELLCMLVSTFSSGRIEIGHMFTGLLLRRLQGATGEVVYVRMGVFEDGRGIFSKFLHWRLKRPFHMYADEGIDLDDARLADSVRIVTVV